MKTSKVEFHNLTRHDLDFSVSVVGTVTGDGQLADDQIVVTVREPPPAKASATEPEKRPP